jgi:hypothetical protein
MLKSGLNLKLQRIGKQFLKLEMTRGNTERKEKRHLEIFALILNIFTAIKDTF